MNAAYIGVCRLDYGVIKRGRVVVLSAYLDNGNDLNAGRRLGACAGEVERVAVPGLSR